MVPTLCNHAIASSFVVGTLGIFSQNLDGSMADNREDLYGKKF
jgi:hypothetical protein